MNEIRQKALQAVAAYALVAQKQYHVPVSIQLAQWALESGFGQHATGFNYFGVKAKGGELGVLLWTKEFIRHHWVRVQALFRVYQSPQDAFLEHARLLTEGKWKNGRLIYEEAMKHTDDARAFARALQGIYATDPNYANELLAVMDSYDLYQYDGPVESIP